MTIDEKHLRPKFKSHKLPQTNRSPSFKYGNRLLKLNQFRRMKSGLIWSTPKKPSTETKQSYFPKIGLVHGKRQRENEIANRRYGGGAFQAHEIVRAGSSNNGASSTITSYSAPSVSPAASNNNTLQYMGQPLPVNPSPTMQQRINQSKYQATVAKESNNSLQDYMRSLLKLGYEIPAFIQNAVDSSKPPATILTTREPVVSRPSYSHYYEREYQAIQAQRSQPMELDDDVLKQQLSAAVEESKQSLSVYKEEESEDEMQTENLEEKLISYRHQSISDEELEHVKNILIRNKKRYGQDDILIDKFNIDVTYSKFICLRPATWLNDEAINFYMLMLQERDDALCKIDSQRRSSHFFNSFFLTKLLENNHYTYSQVRRWSKKFDIFQKDKVFIPVNISNTHWTLCVMYIQKKEIRYFDSMAGGGMQYMKHLKQYIKDEAKDKKQIDLDVSDWKLISVGRGCPQQLNGYDCGVFTITAADFLSDDLRLEYHQDEMPDRRMRIASAILKGSLPYPIP